jgi:hypothetical protein
MAGAKKRKTKFSRGDIAYFHGDRVRVIGPADCPSFTSNWESKDNWYAVTSPAERTNYVAWEGSLLRKEEELVRRLKGE